MYGPDDIFSGKIRILNANIFAATSNGSWKAFGNVEDMDLVANLRKTTAGVYYVLRNVALAILLTMLIYTGIRIVLASTSAQEKAKWREILFNWLKTLALVLFVDGLMVLIFFISDSLVLSLGGILTGNKSFIGEVRDLCWSDWSGAQLAYVIMYGYLLYLTVIFAIAYLKRLFWLIILIVIAPIVSLMYGLGNKKAIFDNWFKEYTMTVFVQPFQLIIYYVLISMPLGLANSNGGYSFITTDIVKTIYCLGAMGFIRPAEKYLRKLFEFDKGLANMASFDSGKQTATAIKKTIEQTVKKIELVAAAVATGGTSAAVAGAGGAGTVGGTIGAAEGTIGAEGALGTGAAEGTIGAEGALDSGVEGTLSSGVEGNSDISGHLGPAGGDDPGTVDSGIGRRSGIDSESTDLDQLLDNYNKPKHIQLFENIKEKIDSNPKLSQGINAAGGFGSIRDDIKEGLHSIGDTFYAEPQDAPKWQEGIKDSREKRAMKEQTKFESFASNKDNINYMIQQHNLMEFHKGDKAKATEHAKSLIKSGEPYYKAGIRDIGTMNKLMGLQQSTGNTPEGTIREYAKGVKQDKKFEQFVTNSDNINYVMSSNNISQEAARERLSESKPYFDSGYNDVRATEKLLAIQQKHDISPKTTISIQKAAEKAKKTGKKIEYTGDDEKTREVIAEINKQLNP